LRQGPILLLTSFMMSAFAMDKNLAPSMSCNDFLSRKVEKKQKNGLK
jgi:hypothetical protein